MSIAKGMTCGRFISTTWAGKSVYWSASNENTYRDFGDCASYGVDNVCGWPWICGGGRVMEPHMPAADDFADYGELQKSQEELAELAGPNIGNRMWRLTNLYFILDERGQRVQFKPNMHQQVLLDEMHYLNIILKARQLGMTTFVCILMLDACVFNSNMRCGVIAHTLDDATAIFKDKIKFPFDNLPLAYRRIVETITDSKTELSLSNNSSIRVGTSMRSGTLQMLLISEFGKICARMPDKAREIVTGALNTIAPGQIAFIESTAEGEEGRFYEMVQAARSRMDQGLRLTQLDWKFFFFPWYDTPRYSLDGHRVPIPSDLTNYFDLLEQELQISLTQGQRAWYARKLETQGEDMRREYPATPDEAFAQAVEGAYYKKEMVFLDSNDRITTVPHDPNLLVNTHWDLGIADSMAVVFTQRVNGERRIIDYYENSGEGLPHYIAMLRGELLDGAHRNRYNYSKHFAPHDIKVRELGSGKSRLEVAEKLGLKFHQTPNIPVIEGISAARQVLPMCWIDQEKCDRLLKCLRNFRKEWDEKAGKWKDRPVHDQYEAGAAAFRYFAINDTEEFEESVLAGLQQTAQGVSLTHHWQEERHERAEGVQILDGGF